MNTNATAIYLRDTMHVLTAFTRRGVPKAAMSEGDLNALLKERLVLRRLQQTDFEPGAPDAPQGRSPVSFEIESNHLSSMAVQLDHPYDAPLLTRPTEFSVIDGKAQTTPGMPVGFQLESIGYKLEAEGITVTVKPKGDTTISQPIAMWATLRLEPDAIFVTAAGELPKVVAANHASSGKLALPALSANSTNEHYLLLMVAGFQPIWDRIGVGGGVRQWTAS